MSLSTHGKEALRNVHGDLACVSVRVRVKQGQLLNSSATRNDLQRIGPELRCPTLRTRYCHQVMELTRDLQLHSGAVARARGEGVSRCFWDLKRESFDQASFQSCRWAPLRLSMERRPLHVFIGEQFDCIYHRKQLKPKHYVLMLYCNDG